MGSKVKNLSYEAQEPAFLQRLRAGNTGPSAADLQIQANRPKGQKSATDDDGPTYVVEGSGETLSKEEYEKLLSGESNSEKNATETAKEAGEDSRSNEKSQNIAVEFGNASKKRKAVKVAGDADEAKASAKAGSEITKKPKPGKPEPKKSKKSKPVKLTFGDDEDD